MKLRTKAAACRIPLLILTVLSFALGLMTLTSCGGGSTGSIDNQDERPNINNVATVKVGTNSAGFPNGLFTSVTVCGPTIRPVGQNPPDGPPSAPTCQTIDNILVDTNSVGLRLIETPAVDSLTLPVVTDSSNNTLQECVQFPDFTYVWGPVARATVQIAGETAAQVPLEGETAKTGIPIQIITSPLYLSTAAPASCLASPPAGGMPIAADTLQTLGAAGILGVGSFLQDCGSACASITPPSQYYTCPSKVCSLAAVPQNLQVWNPVAAFAYDHNGLSLTLPSASGGGSDSITGSLIFGIGTTTNNALGSAEIFAIDAYGNFPQVTLYVPNSDENLPPIPLVNYLSPQNGSYLDTASPAIYFSDAQSLSIPECLDSGSKALGLYCPAFVTNYSADVYGTNNAKVNVSWNVDNAATLLKGGSSVLNALGGDSGIGVSTDYVDLGLPFFLGRTIFVGFAGSTTLSLQSQVITYPNGYWAF